MNFNSLSLSLGVRSLFLNKSFFCFAISFSMFLGSFFIFGLAGQANAATNVYYSVGQVKYNDALGDLKTGTPTVTIADGVATFSEAQTGNIGVGDRVTYGTVGVAYISGRTSQSVWNVITALGAQPTATTTATVNSIGHEFSSLNAAYDGGIVNSTHLNTTNLVTGNYLVNIPCYYDNGPDITPVTNYAYTTSATNYIRIYTATSTSEVNQSQRHTGKWTTTAYRLETNGSSGFVSGSINFLRIDGLQIQVTAATTGKSGISVVGATISAVADIRVSNNIIKGVLSGAATDNSGIEGYFASISSTTVSVRNNVIYDWFNGTNTGNRGIRASGNTIYAYDNTLYHNGIGIQVSPTYNNSVTAKNNIIQNSTAASFWFGTFTASSTKNISDTWRVASSTSDYASTTVAFADPANGDFHIVGGDTVAKDMGADLSGDSAFSFNTDIDGQTRPNGSGWDIGADESYTSGDVTVPTVTAFVIPSTSATLTVPVTTFTTSDDIGVAMYLITESASTPSLNNSSWSTTTPTTYTFTSGGVKTVYAWVRDTSGNISASTSQSVDLTSLGTTYYIDATGGSDSNTGTSTSEAWQTISKVNGRTLLPGDQVLFKRGETWREQLTIPSSGIANYPITFDTYGTGATSTISGSNLVTGWTNYSGNIYVADVGTITVPTQLYVDGVFHDIASTYVGGASPGYMLATTNSVDTTSIIDSNLTLISDDIVGSTVITRAVPWNLSTTVATAYDSGTHKITLNGNVYSSTQVMRTGYGFYLQNKLSMLDTAGEWFYATTTGKLYLWTANGDDPTSHTVEVSNRSYGVQNAGKNYVTIQNLNIKNANLYDVVATSSNNIILNSLALNGGQIGIYATILATSTISSNFVQNTLSNGIQTTSSSNNVTISNNTVNNAGNVGNSPKNSSASIYFSGSSISANSNTIENSGYNGITYGGDQTVVQNNIIDRSCLILDDCGGIYTSNSSSVGGTSIIRGNMVTNSIGNFSGTANTTTNSQGIYLDDLSHGYTVTNNTTYNTDRGFFIHTGYSNTLTNNNAYYSRISGLLITEDNSGGLAGEVAGANHDNIITNNLFESVANSASTYWLGLGTAVHYSQFAGTSGFGTFNSNQYCHPNISNIAVSNKNFNESYVNYSLSAWQTYSGQDSLSTDTTAYCSRPYITTSAASSIAISTATLNGNITANNYASSTIRGFAYGTDSTLATVIATTTETGTFETGAFTKSLTGFTPNTTYYYRAYAVNTSGTTTGAILSIVTLAPVPTSLSASLNGDSISLLVNNLTNSASGSSGYLFTNSTNGTDSGWLTTSFWQDRNLRCGTQYSYSVKYRNQDGINTDSISVAQSTGSCGSAIFFSKPVTNLEPLQPVASVEVENNNPPQSSLASKGVNIIETILSEARQIISHQTEIRLTNFINNGTATTKVLGSGERAGVVNSFESAFGKPPQTENDWSDIIKIANGRWPSQKNVQTETNAEAAFKKIYLRSAKRNNPADDAAVTVIAYGLRPAKRNLNSERVAIKSFRAIYGYAPKSASAWDIVRAIAYSGAKR